MNNTVAEKLQRFRSYSRTKNSTRLNQSTLGFASISSLFSQKNITIENHSLLSGDINYLLP